MNPSDNRGILDELAGELGFDRWGCTPADPIEHGAYYREWLARGRAGTMEYLHRHVQKRVDARALLPGARSVIVVALNYHQPAPEPLDSEPRGRVARYAWGDDYHKVLKRKLFALSDRLRERLVAPFETKVCVDTAPLLEREYAARAGIGWLGKNTMVLHELLGSYFFLGAIVTSLLFDYDAPAIDHCGSCTACLKACPTQAFPAPYEMDASRCISYLTIEHRGETVPSEHHEGVGDWVYGCDVCQEVCPHNRSAPHTEEPRFAIRSPGPYPRLADLLSWSDAKYREILVGSAAKRANPTMWRRNAALANANQRS